MGSAANQVARNGPGGQRFGVTARCNAGTGNCERIESGCKAARCTNLQCGDRRDISAPQLRGNIPSVPVLPGKGNPNGCVSYKAPARNPRTNQRIRPDAVASAIFSDLPVPEFPALLGSNMREFRYTSPHGITVSRSVSKVAYRKGLQHVLRELDRHRGIYLSSGYEYPGRYSRWDIAAVCPPLEIISYDRRVEFRPLNPRGQVLCQMLLPLLASHPHWESFSAEPGMLLGRLKPLPPLFPEEERSKQPSVFSILRLLIDEFRGAEDFRLGLIGAFGYDLLFQFEPIEKRLPRDAHKDLHLFLCDDIYFMDRKKEVIERYQYEFESEGLSTLSLDRSAAEVLAVHQTEPAPIESDHTREEYCANV